MAIPRRNLSAESPAKVEHDGLIRDFNALAREDWDSLGYNEAVPLRREPFTGYVTAWTKGDDYIYRETIITATVDEEAKAAHESKAIRTERDRLLTASDWTQLTDSPLTETDRLAWAEYRQELRNVPQQADFPGTVQWPVHPGQKESNETIL